MGLLDALLSGSGSSGGGLLDFLRNSGMNQQPTGPLASDQAQYQPMNAMAQMQPAFQPPVPQQNAQPSPFDNAQWPYGPGGASSQANAQMPPQQPPPVMQGQPMQVPQPQGNPGGFGAGLSGFISNLHTGPIGALAGGIAGASGLQDPATKMKQQTQNLTMQALIQKGVDPQTAQAAIGNPELLKTLITQTYGPQTITALGNGYVADKNGKITRAYEPEDKIPAGFAKDDSGNMRFIPGGPADPAYIQLAEAKKKDPNGVYTLGRGGELYKIDKDGNPVIVHKNEQANTDSNIPEDTAVFAAERILQGEKGVKAGYGRGAQGPANLLKIDETVARLAKERGITPGELVQRGIDLVGDTSRERTAATQEARMSSAGIEAQGAIKLGREASSAVPRGNWVPVNKAIQAYQSNTSDPNLKKFGAANLTIINTYARAINPNGVGTVADKEHAGEMLRTADGPDAYNAVLDQLDREIELAHRSPAQARAGFRQERSERMGGAPAPHAPSVATAPPKPGDYMWMPGKGLVPKS